MIVTMKVDWQQARRTNRRIAIADDILVTIARAAAGVVFLFSLALAAAAPASAGAVDPAAEGVAAIAPPVAASVRRGIARALACEGEIDDDLGAYEECLWHQAIRSRREGASPRDRARALAGLHFQAWLMSDLNARQGAGRAASLAARHRADFHRQAKAAGLALRDLCAVRRLDCAEIGRRMQAASEPGGRAR